ncbi:MAG: EFR1 family ferrodoxin [Faecalibacillus faecis]
MGVIYPVYAGETPKIVLEFLEKATFETDYFYLILTYGKDDTDAPECIARLLEEKGRHVNYINSILMVDNYLPSFDMNEQRTMNKNIEQQIQQALQDIQNKKKKFLKQYRQGEIFMLLPKKSLRKIQN